MWLYKLQRTCLASYFVALGLQVYAMGLALFGVTTFMPHAILGYSMILGAIVLVVLTIAAKLPRRAQLWAVGVFLLTLLQPVLVLVLRGRAPALAALHPVNALVIFTFAVFVARSTRLPSQPREVA